MDGNMVKKLKIAIIGYGFVGSAVGYGFPDSTCEKYIIDPKRNTKIEDLKGVGIDVSFICVPTPMSSSMHIDASILKDSIEKCKLYTNGPIVIKSTVIPSIVDDLITHKSIIYNPEFLRENTAKEDFINPPMHVFGGDIEYTKKIEKFYEEYSICFPCPVYHMTPSEASFVKYGINAFLMTKVVWFNQFHDLIQDYGSNYNTIIKALTTDTRIGPSHTSVPGHDGRKGASGACFGKDIPAFIAFAKERNKDFTILEEMARRNQEFRNAYGDPLPREKEQNIRFDFNI
jgi:UDPglucose 6-dehydrogenase